MAIYHFSAQVISRSAGRSATAAAAYRSGQEITDERSGEVHDYTRKGAVEHVEIIAPDNAPEWAHDRGSLWNAVEGAEKRKDAQLAREVEVSLPRELDGGQQIDLVRGFVREQFVARGMVADIAIHAPEKGGIEQPHAHIMLTTRQIGPEGFGGKERSWNDRALLDDWRGAWASHANRALERAGHEERIDHRSLEAQRAEALEVAADKSRPESDRRAAELRADDLDREPVPTLSRAVQEMEKRGIRTELGDRKREVQARNAERKALREQLREVRDELVVLAREMGTKAVELARSASQAVRRAVSRGTAPAHPPETDQQRYARMSAAELRAEIARSTPPPVDVAMQSRPDMQAIAKERKSLVSRQEKTQQRRIVVQRELQEWQKAHPVKTWMIDPKYRNESVDRIDHEIHVLGERLRVFDKSHELMIRAIRQQVLDNQAPARRKVAEMEKALQPKLAEEREFETARQEFRRLASRVEAKTRGWEKHYEAAPKELRAALDAHNRIPNVDPYNPQSERNRYTARLNGPSLVKAMKAYQDNAKKIEISRGMDLGL